MSKFTRDVATLRIRSLTGLEEEDTDTSTHEKPMIAGHHLWQRLLAEALGTFAIVFAGCGAIISNEYSNGAVSHAGVGSCIRFGGGDDDLRPWDQFRRRISTRR
jgi:hypothetical protein